MYNLNQLFSGQENTKGIKKLNGISLKVKEVVIITSEISWNR